jgi:mannitol/fructose-specific phosphotransferase system IIA component (Ntr-type)
LYRHMKLSEAITPKRISLDLKATTKDGILEELVRLLHLKRPARLALLQTLQAREELGSTALGDGIAIPHCRSLVISKTLVAVGRSQRGVRFNPPARRLTKLFFLIVAPPVGEHADYLIVLGSVARMARLLAEDKRIRTVKTPRQLIGLVKELEE